METRAARQVSPTPPPIVTKTGSGFDALTHAHTSVDMAPGITSRIVLILR